MNDEEIKQDVLKWRAESPEIVEAWGGQYRWCGPGKWDYRPELFGLEGAFIQACQQPGRRVYHNAIWYQVKDDVMFCGLPSGRTLHYHKPRLVPTSHRLTKGPAVKITFEGYNTNARPGVPRGWVPMDTYGGKLFENVIQGIAADIQAEALVRLESRGYPVVMHTHDEAIAELDNCYGSVDEMAAIMSERPTWASTWPIRADGWEHPRYQKD